MSTRIQRLFRARRSLALLAKRCTSAKVHQPRYVSESYQDRLSGKIQDGHDNAKDHRIDNALYLHHSLSKGYKADGYIGRGQEAGDLDQEGLPMWGDWGIPIRLVSPSGPRNVFFPNFWLRDNCRCSQCVNPDTMQRAFDTFSIPHNIMPTNVLTEPEGLRITWSHKNHTSVYPWDWLDRHSGLKPRRDYLDKKQTYTLWGGEIARNPPSVHYDEIMADDKGVGKWTDKIIQYGFSYVDGCPVSPEKTEELLERIAFIRITHYGGFYDFTSDLTMKDTAYTSLALGAHTDTTYFTDPAGLQMFHLLSHTDGEGGKSLLVDGFNAAKALKRASEEAYEVLSKTPISWHASGNEGITITPGKKFPVLSFADPVNEVSDSRVLQVRWNNDDRGVVDLKDINGKATERQWYEAARLWSEIINRREMQYLAQLEPSRPLIFDNWRVLHGRSAFTGKRRICGGYVNHDDFISRWRNTNFTREQVLKQIL